MKINKQGIISDFFWISFWSRTTQDIRTLMSFSVQFSAPPKEEIDAAVDALEAAIELIRSGQGAGKQRAGGGIGPKMS